MRYSRREFLQAGATGLVWAVAPRSAQAAARVAKQRKIQVGVQLYSVRELCKKDLPGTLKAIKEMGYAGVEFAGYYGKNAAEIKQLLDDNGLVMCGTHTGVDTIRPQNLAKTIEFNLVTGNRYLMVPGMNAKDAQGWIDFAKLFSDAAVTAKAAGMYVGYHNHQHEF